MQNKLWLLFLMMIMPVFQLSCSQQEKTKAADPAKERESVPVEVSKVQSTAISERLEITGEIAPLRQVDIYSRISGLIIDESAKMGQAVRKNMVLARVKQDVPGMEFTPVDIEATAGGIISMDAVETGSRVTPQLPLYTIQDLDQVYLVVHPTESQITLLNPGDSVAINMDALPSKLFHGKITEKLPVIDSRSRMATVKIIIENPHLRLKPGMFGKASITVGQHPGLKVPLDAIVRAGANRYIFQVEDNYARQVMVEIGSLLGNFVEVTGNIKPKNPVVVLGQNLLEDHAPVRIVREFNNENN